MTVRPADRPENAATAEAPGDAAAFAVFRDRDATPLQASDTMTCSNMDAAMTAALGRIQAASGGEGSCSRLVFAGGGMSLVHVWFKSGFPVLLHSHDADCLYYITAGSLRLGTEELGVGDGFLVPADVPYGYVAGPDGVELLEFRTAERFDLRFTAKGERYYDRIVAALAANRPNWRDEPPPGARTAGAPSVSG